MSNSTHLTLPFVEAAQAQKHVTVNDALSRLDALIHIAVESATESSPPVSPAEGQRWIVGDSATGDWTGQEGMIAAWIEGAWTFFTPKVGWQAWVVATRTQLLHDGTVWVEGPATTTAALTSHKASTRIETVELDHFVTAGASNDTALTIPDRAIVFGVTGRVQSDVTGPASWTLGVGVDPQRYGNGIGVGSGSTVNGLSGTPTAYYGATPVRITATGADFTGGTLRLALHYLILAVPDA
jgi:Protein of unknown function (DUF2793)